MRHIRLVASVGAAIAAAAVLPAVSTTAVAVAPATKTVSVAYGDGPVTQDSWDQPLVLTFRGEAGDRVALESDLLCASSDQPVVLEGRSGDVAQTVSGFHRLPARGRYTFTYSHDCWESGGELVPESRPLATVQLLKLEVTKLRPGAAVELRDRRGYVDAASVRITRRTPPLTLRSSDRWARASVVAPSSWRETQPATVLVDSVVAGLPAVIERGALLGVPSYGMADGSSVRPGRYLFWAHGERSPLRLDRLPVVRATVNGKAVRVAAKSITRLAFEGRKGDWVRLRGDATLASLHVGTRRTVRPVSRNRWRLPATRAYWFDVLSRRRGEVAIRSAVPTDR